MSQSKFMVTILTGPYALLPVCNGLRLFRALPTSRRSRLPAYRY